MTLQVDPPGQLQEFLQILKRRKWQIALPALFVLSLGIAFAVVVPKKYEVTTQVELRSITVSGDESRVKSGTKGLAADAPQQIQSMRRITEVIEGLKWPDYLTLSRPERSEFRKRTMENVKVTVPRQSEGASAFVTISYLDVNKERAQEFLKALRDVWIKEVVERDRTRITVEYEKLLDRKSDLEKEWKKLQERRTVLRRDNDISPTQPAPGKGEARPEDRAVDRYGENQDRLEEIDIELATARETLDVRMAQLVDTPAEIPKTAVVKGVSYAEQIASLTALTLELERQLEGIRPQHSRYELTRRKLERTYEQIAELRDLQTENEISQEFVPNPAYKALDHERTQLEAEIARLIAEQTKLNEVVAANKDTMDRLAEAYREDSELTARIDIQTEALKELEIDLQQKKQEREVVTGPAGNPFQITMEVEPPTKPSERDPVLILVFSVVRGLAVGLGGARALECSKDSFRSASDIARVMASPILGVISPIVTRVQRRRRLLLRFTVGTASLLLIGSVLFLTWAWAFEPDLLSGGVIDSIEGFRALFL